MERIRPVENKPFKHFNVITACVFFHMLLIKLAIIRTWLDQATILDKESVTVCASRGRMVVEKNLGVESLF